MRAVLDSFSGNFPPPSPDDEEETGQRFRTIFISDVHLGTPSCQALALMDFLRTHPSDTLYLVGDIIDGWQLRRKWSGHSRTTTWCKNSSGAYAKAAV